MNVMILGTRGVPARHGGFETFAEDLSQFLVQKGHRVTVYCQSSPDQALREDEWNGVHRIFIPARGRALGTVQFDWAAAKDASLKEGIILTLGCNTAIFSVLYRLRGKRNAINMDGLEWRRQKWNKLEQLWLRCNGWAGTWLADRVIADHSEIARRLQRHTSPHKITTIPYGAEPVLSAPLHHLDRFGLSPKSYYLVIARSEPENSILEIVKAFSSITLGDSLIILGDHSDLTNHYQQLVRRAAGPTVRFLGAIYDRSLVRSLRFYAKAYIHGHQVGGTNPSLVESIAAGNAIIAHDNPFTRWVAGPGALYFANQDDLVQIFAKLERCPSQLLTMENDSRVRRQLQFTQEEVLSQYESLLLDLADGK
jgi:glycosyltransferase involved in cell wall biosynthesis